MKKLTQLTKTQIEIISDFSPLTKKIALDMVAAGKSDCELIWLESINEEETKLKNHWFSQMLGDMKSQRYDGRIGQLYDELCKNQNRGNSIIKSARLQEITNRTVNVENIYAKFERYAAQNDGHQCDNFYTLLTLYQNRIKRFDETAYTELTQNSAKIEEIVTRFTQEEKERDLAVEDMLYIIQTIKHINFYRRRGQLPSPELLKTALDSRYADAPKILDEQAKLVLSTYNAYKDEFLAEKVKQICYTFIAESFKTAKRAHPQLIAFLFLGKWISEETFILLKDSYPMIMTMGMAPLILAELKKITLAITDETKLTDTHKYAITLQRIYSK